MNRLQARALFVPMAAILATGCGVDLSPVAPSSSDMVAPSAVGAPYGVDASAIQLSPGSTHQLTARHVANGHAAPDSSLTWTTANSSVATVSQNGLVTAVSGGQTTVAAIRGVHRVEVTVTVTGCGAGPLAMGTTTGALTADDCALAGGHFADFFSLGTAPGEIIELEASGVSGAIGYKEATLDPRAGATYAVLPVGARLRIISNGGRLQAFVRGSPGTLGAYSITRSSPAEAHDCAAYNFVTPGASFGTTITSANACHYAVQYSPVAEAIGKPLVAHGFNIYLSELKPYTVTITGLSDSFDPALTVFRRGVVAQAAPGPLPSPGSRSVTFTPASAGYHYIEVAGGRFIDGLVTWEAQTGSYHLTVSQ